MDEVKQMLLGIISEVGVLRERASVMATDLEEVLGQMEEALRLLCAVDLAVDADSLMAAAEAKVAKEGGDDDKARWLNPERDF